ncbi:MAG: glycosyltransferase family 4 protein [Candidatus Magasanikbacteria bacterium]|nr:glycosyltransferase family 4 protein [Candidatus Magasanikbacteria bacterium]
MTLKKIPKIFLITLEFPPQIGGVSRYYDGLVKHWSGEIKVMPANLKCPLWPHWLPLIWRVGKIVKKEKIEMLWVGQVLPVGYVALWFKRRKKVPYTVFTHGMDILVPQKSRWKKYWLKKILFNAELVVANSQFTRGELIKLGVVEWRIIVVYPCPVEMKDSSLALLPQNDIEKIILSVGRLVKRKGFDKVIDVMPRLLKRVPDLKYVIIGNGPEIAALQNQIAELGLSDNVEILEKVYDKELQEWYNKCTLFALPCRQIGVDVEGFGLVFLEAALAGKPVVAGNSGGAPETIRHGYGGFVIEPDSPDELYQALLKILTDEPFANRLGDYGCDWVSRNFQWEKEIEKLKEKIN